MLLLLLLYKARQSQVYFSIFIHMINFRTNINNLDEMSLLSSIFLFFPGKEDFMSKRTNF